MRLEISGLGDATLIYLLQPNALGARGKVELTRENFAPDDTELD